jgi:hypothetical protein
MFNRSTPLVLVLVPFLAFVTARFSSATELTEAQWQGDNFVLAFSGEVKYQVDLALTDSTQVVVRVDNATASGDFLTGTQIAGPNGYSAILTANGNGVRLRIIAPQRIGFSTLWKPYSDRLVVNTFDWDSLDYAEEQYHNGLLALEHGFNETAEELLKVAQATGESRAGAVLGTYYARLGKQELARHYLQNPITRDEFLALADIEQKAGNTAAADAARSQAEDALDIEPERSVADQTPAQNELPAQNVREIEEWVYYVVGAALLLLLAVGAYFMFSGGGKPAEGESRPVSVKTSPKSSDDTAAATRQTPQTNAAPTAATSGAVTTVEELPPPAEPESAQDEQQEIAQELQAEQAAIEAERESTEAANAKQPATPPIADAEQETAEEPPAEEPTTEKIDEPEATAEDEEASDSEADSEERIPYQAEQLRRRIQSVRRDSPAPAEPIISAARRLNISRDNVELRKKVEDARKKNV